MANLLDWAATSASPPFREVAARRSTPVPLGGRQFRLPTATRYSLRSGSRKWTRVAYTSGALHTHIEETGKGRVDARRQCVRHVIPGTAATSGLETSAKAADVVNAEDGTRLLADRNRRIKNLPLGEGLLFPAALE